MKKKLAFTIASIMTISSMSTLASAAPMYSFATERDENGQYIGTATLNKYGVPEKDTVEVGLDITTGWTENSYSNHTKSNPLKKTASRAEFYSKATLDMSQVAAEWEAYMDAAVKYAKDKLNLSEETARQQALEKTTVTGSYDLVITVPGTGSYADKTLKGIENENLAANPATGWEWAATTVGDSSYSVESFFEPQNPATSYVEADGTRTFTLKMKVKDDVNKTLLDEYFTNINGESGDSYKYLTLLVPKSYVGGQSKTYEITGTLTGGVKLSVGMLGVECSIDFKDAADTEYVYLSTSSGGGGSSSSGTTIKPTAAPTEKPSEAPTAAPTDQPTEKPADDKKDEQSKDQENVGSMNAFIDVDKEDWFYESVEYANKNGLMGGTSSTEFAPNENITRGMLVTVLYRAEGQPAVNKSIPFVDVKSDQYYANAVIWAEQCGIVNGISDTEFAPDVNITREQIAAIMFRYASFKEYDLSVGENTNILSYTDYNEISEYAIEAMQYVVGSGIMTGKTDTTLNPQDNATRAEIATILQRFIEGNK